MDNTQRDLLLNRISRCNAVLSELKDSQAWRILMEDFMQHKTMIDDNWHLVPQDKLDQFRITKLAVTKVMNTLVDYEHDMVKATQELEKLDNPGVHVGLDYDNE